MARVGGRCFGCVVLAVPRSYLSFFFDATLAGQAGQFIRQANRNGGQYVLATGNTTSTNVIDAEIRRGDDILNRTDEPSAISLFGVG
jgi:hypothetical protein